jgi:hypothetical protein
LTYWPDSDHELGLFSTTGCKRISQKVDLALEEEEDDKDEL